MLGCLDATVGTLIGTAIGAIAGIAGSVLITFLTNRSQERRHLRDTAVKLAIDNWKIAVDLGKNSAVDVLPLDLYLIHSVRLTQLAGDPSVSSENIREKLKELHALMKNASAEIESYSEPLMRKLRGDVDAVEDDAQA
jgi:hypothetical protein